MGSRMLPLLFAALWPAGLITCPPAIGLRSARCPSACSPDLHTPSASAVTRSDGASSARALRGTPAPPLMGMAKAIPRRQARSKRRLSKEALAAKGFASAALLRLAYSSPAWALASSLMLPIVIVSPVIAIEAILLTAALCFSGIASYWPANVGVFALGTAGVAGCLNGVIIFWEGRLQRRRDRVAARNRRRALARGDRTSDTSRQARDAEEDTVPDDGSGGLVVLLVSALTAAIVGALP